MRHTIPAILILAALTATSPQHIAAAQQWESLRSGTDARLRGLSAVSDTVAWASGARGTILRTIDGGRVWQPVTIPDTASLDFRDIDAISERVAYVLSIGNGPASRIYKTSDGGQTWTLQFQNANAAAFFDAMAFWDEQRGIAISDSVGGRFVIIRTSDGGATWTPVPASALPPALDNEGAFAASGTNVAVFGTKHAWIGTGAASKARVLRSTDGGATWTIADTPLAAGASAGIYSIAFRDARHGLIVGGDYAKEDEAVDNAALTSDGGKTWKAATGLSGYRSVVASLPGRGRFQLWLAIGPNGADVSSNDGRTWKQVSSLGFDTASIGRAANGEPVVFAAGANGRLGRLRFQL